jgi:hypothetical protein
MPGSDTVLIISEQRCRSLLEQAGFQVTACWELTQSHVAVAERLAEAFTKNGEVDCLNHGAILLERHNKVASTMGEVVQHGTSAYLRGCLETKPL